MDQYDLKGIDWKGLPEPVIDEHGEAYITLEAVTIGITKRPYYCDRGRYGVLVDVNHGFHERLNIDFADGFPRYFFSLQRLVDEIADWIEIRKIEIPEPQ